MDKTKPPKSSFHALILNALKNRYDLLDVCIAQDGTVTGSVGDSIPRIPFGNVSEYTWDRCDERAAVAKLPPRVHIRPRCLKIFDFFPETFL